MKFSERENTGSITYKNSPDHFVYPPNCIQMIGEVLTATVLVYDEMVNISMDETSI